MLMLEITHPTGMGICMLIEIRPIHWACRKGHEGISNLLVNKGNCRLDLVNNDGDTPLHRLDSRACVLSVELHVVVTQT